MDSTEEGLMSKQDKAPNRVFVWKPTHEAVIVALGAREALAKGKSKLEALLQGQKLLPPSKRLEREQLVRFTYPSSKLLDNALKRAAQLSNEQIRALLPNAKHLPAAAPEHSDVPYVPKRFTLLAPADYKGRGSPVSWDDIELARLSRRVDYWQTMGSDCGEVRLLQEAQEIELPPDRRRPRGSISAGGAGPLKRDMARGRELQHLLADIPFDPTLQHWVDAAPAQEAPPPAPAPIPQAEAQSPAVEAPSPVAAPIPAPAPAPAVPSTSQAHESARLLGIGFANAMVPLVEQMLLSHEQQIMARLGEQLRAAMDANAQTLAAQMTRLMGLEIDRLLGGSPSSEVSGGGDANAGKTGSVTSDAAAVAAAAPQALPRLKVDVVGLERGHQKMMVEHKLNGHADRFDLRFIGPDDKYTYEPTKDRYVIVLRGRVPHSITELLKSRGCKPHYVNRTVGEVVQAIEGLLVQSP